jgi:hypothetical protein
MVRIVIKRPAVVPQEVVCTGRCGSTLSYVPKDIKSYHGRDDWGGPDGYEWIVCPVCKEEIVLKSW